ncbi:MAG TPA: protein-S-isoprenylcysteine O-methyltransferase [Planctomycetota bacterium]|nr:protein-S-isoprenylcysteine O-methyltransferase [Planctomycetota bacterium]
MNPWFGAIPFLVALAASIAMRAPHIERGKTVKVVQSHKGKLERVLFALVGIGGLLLPLLYLATPWLAFADYPLRPWALACGLALIAVWLWLFHRSHADLGTNWSVSLELRERHSLITSGVYSRLRHPMYAAIFCHAIAQALLLANWIAGPAMLVAFTLMFALRLSREERMLRQHFGAAYEDYAKRTKRLVPGIW